MLRIEPLLESSTCFAWKLQGLLPLGFSWGGMGALLALSEAIVLVTTQVLEERPIEPPEAMGMQTLAGGAHTQGMILQFLGNPKQQDIGAFKAFAGSSRLCRHVAITSYVGSRLPEEPDMEDVVIMRKLLQASRAEGGGGRARRHPRAP